MRSGRGGERFGGLLNPLALLAQLFLDDRRRYAVPLGELLNRRRRDELVALPQTHERVGDAEERCHRSLTLLQLVALACPEIHRRTPFATQIGAVGWPGTGRGGAARTDRARGTDSANSPCRRSAHASIADPAQPNGRF